MYSCVTIPTKCFQIVFAQCYVRIRDVIRSQFRDVVNGVSGFDYSLFKTSLAESFITRPYVRSYLLPSFRLIKLLCPILHALAPHPCAIQERLTHSTHHVTKKRTDVSALSSGKDRSCRTDYKGESTVILFGGNIKTMDISSCMIRIPKYSRKTSSVFSALFPLFRTIMSQDEIMPGHIVRMLLFSLRDVFCTPSLSRCGRYGS